MKHEQVEEEFLKRWFLSRIGLDTMLDCIELTKEQSSTRTPYIVMSRLCIGVLIREQKDKRAK